MNKHIFAAIASIAIAGLLAAHSVSAKEAGFNELMTDHDPRTVAVTGLDEGGSLASRPFSAFDNAAL